MTRCTPLFCAFALIMLSPLSVFAQAPPETTDETPTTGLGTEQGVDTASSEDMGAADVVEESLEDFADDDINAEFIVLDDDGDFTDEDADLVDEDGEFLAELEFVSMDVWSKLPLDFELIGPNQRDQRDTAGTAHTLSEDQIERLAPRSTAELLDYLPNVTIANTDSMGLRLNLGMRGFPPGQSTYTLVLEDGIPIAAAPYLDGTILYTTPVEKIARVELLTGSSSILHGPQNMGGAINLVTKAPPRAFTTSGYLEGGSFGRLNLGASVGDTKGVVAYLLQAHHRRFEGPRQLDLQSTDLSAKFRLQPSERSWFGAKLSIYDEFSRASQTGLTQSIFDQDPHTIVSPYDRHELDRLAASIQHTYLISENGMIQTSLWASTMTRQLQQQRFDRQDRALDGYERVILGEEGTGSGDRGSLYFLDATDILKERYSTLGAESRLTFDIALGKLGRDELILGVRGTQEDIDRETQRGQHGGSPSGTSLLDEERTGNSLATYTLSRFFFFKDRLRVEPGVRLEFLRSERRVWRDTLDGEPVDFNPPRDGGDTSTALLPGVGSSFDLGKHVTFFGSAHRSMALPEERLASALIDPEVNLAPEFAWNFELGTRLYDRDRIQLDVAGFLIATQNLTLPVTSLANSSQAFEAGETRHLGAEASLQADPFSYFRTILSFPVSLNYAYTHATLAEGWGQPIEGNFVPHVPKHKASAQIGAVHPLGFAAQLSGRYTGERFSEIENVSEPSLNGIRGLIQPRTEIDARLAYTHTPWNVTFHMLGKNLLDQRVITTRSASGVQVTGAREFIAGAKAEF